VYAADVFSLLISRTLISEDAPMVMSKTGIHVCAVLLHCCSGHLTVFLRGRNTLAGRVKSFCRSRTRCIIFNRIHQVAPAAEEWVTVMLGCISASSCSSIQSHYHMSCALICCQLLQQAELSVTVDDDVDTVMMMV